MLKIEQAFEKDSLDSSDFSPGNESFEDFYSKREKFIKFILQVC